MRVGVLVWIVKLLKMQSPQCVPRPRPLVQNEHHPHHPQTPLLGRARVCVCCLCGWMGSKINSFVVHIHSCARAPNTRSSIRAQAHQLAAAIISREGAGWRWVVLRGWWWRRWWSLPCSDSESGFSVCGGSAARLTTFCFYVTHTHAKNQSLRVAR